MTNSFLRDWLVAAIVTFCGFVAVFRGSSPVSAEVLFILNEYTQTEGEPSVGGGGRGTYFGRVLENGENWIEIVVVRDHAHWRTHRLIWREAAGDEMTAGQIGRALGSIAHGRTISRDRALWFDVMSGTTAIFSEKQPVNAIYNCVVSTALEPSARESQVLSTGDSLVHGRIHWEAAIPSVRVVRRTNIDTDTPWLSSAGGRYHGIRLGDGAMPPFDLMGKVGAGWHVTRKGNQERTKHEANPTTSRDVIAGQGGVTNTPDPADTQGGRSTIGPLSMLRAVVFPESAAATVFVLIVAAGVGFAARRCSS